MSASETILRKKLSPVAGASDAPTPESGARAWRTAFARAAREEVGLSLGAEVVRDDRLSLAEVLEYLPSQALLAVLEGPETGLGVLAMSPQLTSSIIEAQTTGRLSPGPALPRRPTRTDAAMCAGMIDRAMMGLEGTVSSSLDLVWAGGFRYASFLEEARALSLLLEDIPYRVLRADIAIENGAREGHVLLALPAEGRGPEPIAPPDTGRYSAERLEWQQALRDSVMGAEIVVEATMGRVLLPLGKAKTLAVGTVLPLDGARTDEVKLKVSSGMALPAGRLGQHRGLRAIKLTLPADGITLEGLAVDAALETIIATAASKAPAT